MNNKNWMHYLAIYTIGLIIGAGSAMVIFHKILLQSEAILK